MMAGLYDVMFKRRSIRKFKNEPLEEAQLTSISSFMKELKPMRDGIKTELYILKKEDIKSRLAVKAPCFIAIYSEDKEDYLVNAGFMLQQLDLYLASIGLGSCWQGLAKPKKNSERGVGLRYVIMLAFGRSSEPINMDMNACPKRRPIEDISNAKGMDEIIEPARIAPSAMNTQPWYFTGENGRVDVYCKTSLMHGNMDKVSVGIAICHMYIAAEHFGRTVHFTHDEKGKGNMFHPNMNAS